MALFIVVDINEEMLGRRLTPLYAIRTMRLLFYTAAMRFLTTSTNWSFGKYAKPKNQNQTKSF